MVSMRAMAHALLRLLMAEVALTDGTRHTGFLPDSPIPPFKVPTANGIVSWPPTRSLSADRSLLPLVVMTYDDANPFLERIITDEISLSGFLSGVVPNCTFVFLASDEASLGVAHDHLTAQIDRMAMDPQVKAQWLQRLVFANESIPAMRARADHTFGTLPDVLDEWVAQAKTIAVHPAGREAGSADRVEGTVVMSRLDGFFQWTNTQDLHNHSPKPVLQGTLVMNGSPCGCAIGNFTGKFVLLDMTEMPCSGETAVKFVLHDSPAAIIVMQPKGVPLRVLGQNITADDEDAFTTLATMVSHNEQVLQALDAAPEGLPVTYALSPTPGWFMSVSEDGTLKEIGLAINPLLNVLRFQAAGLAYHQQLKDRLAAPGMSIPIFDHAVGVVTANVTLPSPDELTQFDSAAFEIELTCGGPKDLDCDPWDQTVSLTAVCRGNETQLGGGDVAELARWITPYRRRVGHWLVPAPQLLAVVAPNMVPVGSHSDLPLSCSFTVDMPPWIGSKWVSTIHLRLGNTDHGTGNHDGSPNDGVNEHLEQDMLKVEPSAMASSGKALFCNGHPSEGNQQVFNSSYNKRQAVSFDVPAGTRRVVLQALVTGHGDDETYGCCEFLPSKHTFVVNGESFTLSLMEPLDPQACTTHVDQGVEPNGYGAWWFGRNGWCNGMAILPWVEDITEAVSGTTNTVVYTAQMYHQGRWVEPNSTDGVLFVSSRLSLIHI